MPRYERAPALVGLIIEKMRDRYHPQLRDAGVTITSLMAYPLTDENGDSKGPALKHQGYPAQAVVKIVGLKERTDGRADAELVIDGDNWDVLTDEERDALIDHELEHLELKYDKEGCLVRDDLDRPKLTIRRHDFQAGFFDAVVRRHGKASLEWRHYQDFVTVHYEQRWLPYLDEPDTSPVVADPIREQAPESDGSNKGVESSGGIESVTISSPGRGSVTMTPKQFGDLANNIKKSKRCKSDRKLAAAGK